MSTVRWLHIATLAATLPLGCIRRDRLNADCRWYGEQPRQLDLSTNVDQRHLRDDAWLAEELGIRHGDATRGRESIPERARRREGCTGALFDQVGRLHSIPTEAVAAAGLQREAWVDFVFVFLPAALLYWMACKIVVGRINGRFLPDEPRTALAMMLLAAPFVSGLGLALGEAWSWIIEMIRVGDGHISYRAFRLPWVRHRLAIFLTAIVLFLLIELLRRMRSYLHQSHPQ